jgi:plasmid stabilization system protein ParE
MTLYQVADEAQSDLFEIWDHIAKDSLSLADRIDGEFHGLFASLGRTPGLGHTRKDLTKKPELFFPLHSFLVVYQPANPVRIMAVLRGHRDVKRLLRGRL